jgi:zinc transport system substrate-binding protein
LFVRRQRSLNQGGIVSLAVLGLGFLTGCSSTEQGSHRLPIAVSILPQAYFVERIGGDLVDVIVAVAPGESPASFDATPRQVARLAQANIYFAIGVPMENQLLSRLRSGFPNLDIVDTSIGIERRVLAAHHHHEPASSHTTPPLPDTEDRSHDHPHPEHAAPATGGHEFDPHIWLNPRLVQEQARHIAEALAKLDPDHAVMYRARKDSFIAELAALDDELTALLAPVKGRDLVVFHPALGYLADAYGLHQVAIEQGGLDPSPRHVAEVLTRLREQGVCAVFVQPQFSLGSARAVAQAAEVEIVVIDPLASDYPSNLRSMARAIREALDGG